MKYTLSDGKMDDRNDSTARLVNQLKNTTLEGSSIPFPYPSQTNNSGPGNLLQPSLPKLDFEALYLAKTRHLQDQIRVTDLKDRSIAEHNFERVNFMSTVYVIILVISGLSQVALLRSLFDDKSKINPLWKKAFKD